MLAVADTERSTSTDGAMRLQPIRLGLESPVFVVFTSIDRTLRALEKASQLAKALGSEIEILAVQTVPFTLPLDNPSAPFEFLVRRLKGMVAQFPMHIRISAYVCRDRLEALKCVLNHPCPVVIGIRKRWWPTRDERVARKLRRAGYNVILVETG